MQALPLAPGRPFSKSNKVKGLIGEMKEHPGVRGSSS